MDKFFPQIASQGKLVSIFMSFCNSAPQSHGSFSSMYPCEMAGTLILVEGALPHDILNCCGGLVIAKVSPLLAVTIVAFESKHVVVPLWRPRSIGLFASRSRGTKHIEFDSGWQYVSSLIQ
uniref:Uncharacterized protein n=1 Tax=Cacopsylla melanoneura TaxID=428564 RepID=A0A8D8LXZ9_9HEMI